MSRYDLEEVRRRMRMKKIPAGWKPRPRLDRRESSLVPFIRFPKIEMPLPMGYYGGNEDLLRASKWRQDCWWIDGIGVNLTTPTDPGRNPEITVELGIFIASAKAMPDVGIDRGTFYFSWDPDSGGFSGLWPDMTVGPFSLKELRRNPCWCLIRPSVQAGLAAIIEDYSLE